MVTILIISAKIATPGLLKIKLFSNKGCDVITFAHDASNQCDEGVKTKSQEFSWANLYICRSYRCETGRGNLFAHHSE